MLSRRDALLNLAPLLNRYPGAADEMVGSGLLQPEADLLEAAALLLRGPLRWEVVVRNPGGDDDFIVAGSVSGQALQECRRCLTEVVTEARAEFVLPMLYLASEGALRLDEFSDDDEERLVFGRPEVDFAPLLTQLFAIELPLSALCREDCRGLSLDGINLNEHPELVAGDRDHRVSRSPFEALKDIDDLASR